MLPPLFATLPFFEVSRTSFCENVINAYIEKRKRYFYDGIFILNEMMWLLKKDVNIFEN